MTSGTNRQRSVDLVTRAEFEQFERIVQSGFSSLREDYAQIARKIDSIVTRGTDWRAILAALSVATAVISLIGGVVASGIADRIEHGAQNTQEVKRDVQAITRSLDATLQREMRILDDRLQAEMRLLDTHQTELTQSRLQTLEAIVPTRDDVNTLDKRINALETSFSILSGRAPGTGGPSK